MALDRSSQVANGTKEDEDAASAKAMMDLVESLSSQLSKKSLYFQKETQRNLLGKSSKRKRESSIDYGLSNSPAKTSAIERRKSFSPFYIDWDLFKAWPEGIREEEKSFEEYLDRLKMVSIEEMAKIKFMESTMDKVIDENNEEEESEEVYSMSHALKLEAEAEELKERYEGRKEGVMSTRRQIEALTDELHEFDSLKRSLKEARDLSSGIREMEGQLKRLRESNEAQRMSSNLGRNPLTKEEAEQKVIAQHDGDPNKD
ncbi:hypothetical protein CBS101457_005428 [Exobasidium rhododendri]|nr:hypothetical protein CBS101457_005428 [Exobasidium rhododendri]